MAADLSVLLELDDRPYQRGLKDAERSAQQFGSKFKNSMTQVGQSIDALNSKLGSFNQLLLSAGIGAFITNIARGAAEITTMSRALSVSTESFLEMSTAAASVGVNAAGLTDRISEMTARVAEAANGNLSLRDAFSAIGVSIQDMRSLAPDDLFNKIAQNLANIVDPAQRAAIAGKLLGEEGRKIDWSGYANGLGQVQGRMGEYAAAQENLSKITKDFAQFTNLLKLEFANILGPIAEMIGVTGDLDTQMGAAEVTAKALAAAMALFAASSVVSVMRSIGAAVGIFAAATAAATGAQAANTKATFTQAEAQLFMAGAYGRVGRAVSAVADAEYKLAQAQARSGTTAAAIAKLTDKLAGARLQLASATEAFAVTEAHAQRIMAAGGISQLADTTATTANTTATTANTTAKAANATATAAVGTASTAAATGVGTLTAATAGLQARLMTLLPLATTVAATLGMVFYSPELNAGEEQTIKNMQEFGEKLKQLDTAELEKYYELINKNPGNGGYQDNSAAALAQAAPGKFGNAGVLGAAEWKDMTVAAQQRAEAIARETQLMTAQNERVRERSELETSLMGRTRVEREAILKTFDAETQKRQKVYEIQGKIAELEKQMAADPGKAAAEGTQLIIDAYRQQLEEVYKLTDGVYELTRAELERANAIDMQKYFYDQQQKAQEAMLSIEHEIADLTATEGERRIAQVDRLIEREKKLAIEKRKQQLGITGDLEMSEVKAIEEQIEDAYGGLRQKTRDLLAESRSWETGWKRAMKSYVDEATNGAKKAEDIFSKAFQGMEDLLVDFAKTGEFEWKQFVAMMLEELLRAQIQAVFASMIGDMTGAMQASAGFFGGGSKSSDPMGDFIMNLPGMKDDKKGSSGGGVWDTVSSVGSSVWEGTKNVASGVWDTVSSVGSSVWEGTKNVASGVWDTVSSVGSSVWDTVSSVGSAVGDFFGGFFANGGTLGAGKWGIAGEAGPEIISGPAQITPMSKMGGSTNVTYNINAVDVRSFQQLLAQNPGFIHGLVMQGARGIPSGR